MGWYVTSYTVCTVSVNPKSKNAYTVVLRDYGNVDIFTSNPCSRKNSIVALSKPQTYSTVDFSQELITGWALFGNQTECQMQSAALFPVKHVQVHVATSKGRENSFNL